MPKCTRPGCGKLFDENNNGNCLYHTGAPVFHEGLKSWSCCNQVQKPVLEFDEFMKISGCTEADLHTSEAHKVEPPQAQSTTSFQMSETTPGKEVYSFGVKPAPTELASPLPSELASVVEEQDDLTVEVALGTKCRHNGCNAVFISDSVSRGDGEGSSCNYHPAPPIFREGSKGYLCCKRRVLEFDEFLKISGCKTGKHLFSPAKTTSITEQVTTCRIDHYQTVDKVHVSIFARQADQELSTINFEEMQVKLDIYLPGPKRFARTLDLFGPIDPERSSHQFFNAKIELHLQKKDTRSWTILEKTTRDIGGLSLTFGVGGRTGTVGAKEVILDDVNKLRGTI